MTLATLAGGKIPIDEVSIQGDAKTPTTAKFLNDGGPQPTHKCSSPCATYLETDRARPAKEQIMNPAVSMPIFLGLITTC